MNHETTIEVDGQKYTIKLMSVRREEDIPRLVEFARQSIRSSDRKPVGGAIEVDGVMVRIGLAEES